MARDWSEAKEKCEEEGCCRYCGKEYPEDEYPDPAHVVPRSLGGGQAKASIIPLCRGCHTQYDEGQIGILGIATLEEELEAVRTLGSLTRAYEYLGGYRKGTKEIEG